jgi:predicted transposase/invertase (TIGR01784 family)
VNVVVAELSDEFLLAEENRIGFVLYAVKCARASGDDEGKKFRYLRDISTLRARRKWDPEEKRIILLAVEYLIRLESKDYKKQFVNHLASLTASLTEEEKVMYISAFESVYKDEGRMEGRMEGRVEGRMERNMEVAQNMLNDGLPIEKVVQYTELPREEVETLVK